MGDWPSDVCKMTKALMYNIKDRLAMHHLHHAEDITYYSRK